MAIVKKTKNKKQKHPFGDFYFYVFKFYLLRQFAEVCASNLPGAKLGDLETADDVLQGGRHHKVLLLQTELLAFKELRMKTHICQFVFSSRAH